MNTKIGTKNIKINGNIHIRIKTRAAIEDRKIQEVVEEAISNYLISKEHDKNHNKMSS